MLGLGLEREPRGKPAGLRSHMLVAPGTAFLTVGLEILFTAVEASSAPAPSSAPCPAIVAATERARL